METLDEFNLRDALKRMSDLFNRYLDGTPFKGNILSKESLRFEHNEIMKEINVFVFGYENEKMKVELK